MNLAANDFELFGLAPRFAQDPSEVDARWKALQRQAHPDRFAAQAQAAQRLALQWAIRINEARQRLKDPLQRAAYLCQLRGVDIAAESNTAMPAAFLQQQIIWREALEEADSPQARQALHTQLHQAMQSGLGELERLLDQQGDVPAAAAQVRALMFVQRLLQQAQHTTQALTQP